MNQQKVRKFKRGIYILPNLITTASVFCSFYAMVALFDGKFISACWAIIVAIIFDGLDGRVARLTNTTSNFGLQLDSLADAVSFGVAPALLLYAYALHDLGRLGWLAAFFYVICGILRLARFNIQDPNSETTKEGFIGLPIPGAAGFLAMTVIVIEGYIGFAHVPSFLFLLLTYVLALLMVSNIPYTSFKSVKLRYRKSFPVFISVLLALYIIAVIPELLLFLLGVYYVFSSPFVWAYRKLKGGGKTDSGIKGTEKKAQDMNSPDEITDNNQNNSLSDNLKEGKDNHDEYNYERDTDERR